MRLPAFCSLAAFAIGLASCTTPAPQPNVVVLLVDTLRADRMSLYGYERATTPRLAARAATAVVFESARSQASCTFPSVNSLLTSRYPFHFYGQHGDTWAIPPSIPTLAQILARHGYATFAVSASSVVRATPSKVNRTGGYGAGFETFDESCERRDASCINARTLALARASRRPFFGYLHYMEPHHPYSPPPAWRNHFATPDVALPPPIRAGRPNPILTSLYTRKEKKDWSREVAYLSDSYDDEIRYVDHALDKLIERLAKVDPDRDTVVVLAADHGEDFLEHGDLMHCRTLHDTTLHVPLVMWLPGVSGRRIASSVQNVDIVPTLLDYLGIDAKGEAFEGRSLRGVIEGTAGPAPAWAAHYSQRSLVDGHSKLIYDLDTGTARLFDIAADPGEQNDLAAATPDHVRELERKLLERVGATEGADPQSAARLSKDVQERLRAVGYIE